MPTESDPHARVSAVPAAGPPLAEHPLATRRDLADLAAALLRPLPAHLNAAGSGLALGASAAHYRPECAEMEALLRPLFGLAPLAAGGGRSELWPTWRRAIAAGTDPAHPGYWGPVRPHDQAMVEMAALGIALAMAPAEAWEPLSPAERGHLGRWLLQINGCGLAANNWLFFTVLVNVGLKRVGAPFSQEAIEAALDRLEGAWLADGWYADGPTQQRDHYIPFAMHFYGLLYSVFEGRADPRRARLYQERARAFAQDFLHWFAADGSALPYGRSLTYRFAMAAFWGALAYAGVEALPWGVLKGLLLRHLRWWIQRPIVDAAGLLTIGYGYPNLKMAEFYNAPGSPYWALKAFLPLALPEDHPFWTAQELPLPEAPPCVAQPHPHLIFCREARRDHLFALAGGQYATWEPTFNAAKYAKFAYSTAFGFSVPAGEYGLEQGAFDSALALCEYDHYFRARRACEQVHVTPECHYSRWRPWPDVTIDTWLLPLPPWHVRIHRVSSGRRLLSAEGGFALRRDFHAQPPAGACVENRWGLSGVRDLLGGRTPVVIQAAPNTNLLHPQTEIPTLLGPLERGVTWLACAVLGQPAVAGLPYDWNDPPRLARTARGFRVQGAGLQRELDLGPGA